jgi:hypothetical protein
LNQPIFAYQPATPRAGKIGKVFSLVRTSSPQVSVMAIKKAEKSANYIIRVRETQGANATGVKLIFPATSTIVAASEVTGLEEAKGAATFSGKELTFNMTKYQPKTFSVQLAAPVAVIQKFGDFLQPRPSEVTLTVALAFSKKSIATIKLPYGERIRGISIVDATGRIVQKMAREGNITSASTIVWDGGDMNAQRVRAGVYFVNCETGHGRVTTRLTMVQ